MTDFNVSENNRSLLSAVCFCYYLFHSGNELEEIHSKLEKCWEENVGSNILYLWTEKIRDFLFARFERAKLFIESPEEDKEREREYLVYFKLKSLPNGPSHPFPILLIKRFYCCY